MTPVTQDASRRAARFGGAALALLSAWGCSGSVNASAKASSAGDMSAEGDTAWDMSDESQSEEQTALRAASSESGSPALLGARHDLTPAQVAEQACGCLRVAIGPPSSTAFTWTGAQPTIDPMTQTVIALGSEGVPCSQEGPGASYMGYVKEKGDVIVTVEAAVAGRPVTHGAIIPKPDPGKRIYVQPSGNIPYGRGKNGEARCALGSGQ